MKIARAIGTDITRTFSKLEKLTLLAKYVFYVSQNQVSGTGAESRGAEIILPPGAGSEITN
jgi:hypothetical protein